MNQICIISNADIILDDTISVVKGADLDKVFLALTRGEVFCENGEWCIAPFDNASSQDVWIFKSPIIILLEVIVIGA